MEISIIITNYNYERFLSRAIRSAVNQTFNKDEYEIIVIDDCSIDNSRSIIESFAGVSKSIFNDKNEGLAKSCNKAIMAASGKFIYRLDSDDYIEKNALMVSHMFASNNKSDMDAISCDYYEVNLKEEILMRRNGITFPIACGVLFKTDDMLELGLYNYEIPREDIDFRNRFLKSGRHIYNLPLPLYRYTQHGKSVTKNIGDDKCRK